MQSVVCPILIAACGNELAGEDAFGPLVAHELRDRLPEGVEVVDLGMNPTALVDHLEGRRVLVIVDAAQCPGVAAGTPIECDWDAPDRPALVSERALSTHGVSIGDQVELARNLGLLPGVVRLFCVNMNWSENPADRGNAVRENVLATAARVLEFVSKLRI